MGKLHCHIPGHKVGRTSINIDTKEALTDSSPKALAALQTSRFLIYGLSFPCLLLPTQALSTFPWGFCFAVEAGRSHKPCELQLLTLGSVSHTQPRDRKEFFQVARLSETV